MVLKFIVKNVITNLPASLRGRALRRMWIYVLFAKTKLLPKLRSEDGGDNMTKREFLDKVFALVPNEANAIMDAFDEYVESNEPHWIPVTENCDCDLMDNEEVLVFQKDGTINGQIRHAMFYDFNGKKKFVTWEEGITIYNVLAYMPLPEPYKGVTDGRN